MTDLENVSDGSIDEDEVSEVTEQDSAQDVDRGRKKKAFKYQDSNDIQILLEVTAEKPFGHGKSAAQKWQIIYDKLKFPVPSYRSIQSRFYLLLKAFRQETLKSMRASGTEEDFDEKKRLLTDIVELMKDWESEEKQTSETQKKKTDDEHRRATEIREASLRSLSDPDTPPSQPAHQKSRKRKLDYEELLQASEDERNQIERRRLDLMEKQLLLAEKNDEHRRKMEERRMAFEENQMKLEAEKRAREHEEKTLLFNLLKNKMNP